MHRPNLAASLLAFLSAVCAWPNPEAMTGVIPNHPGDTTLDPTLIRRSSDSKLFLFFTGGNVWNADSLYGPWTKNSEIVFDEHCSAPAAYEIDNTYYLFYSHNFSYPSVGVTNPNATEYYHDSSILVRTSDTLEPGSWTAQGRLNITWAQRYNILDASLLTIDNGSATENFLSFGSYQKGIFQIPLANPPTALAAAANSEITHLAENTTTTLDPSEASYQFQYGDYYYLFFSSGQCCPNRPWPSAGDVYKVMVCRSQTPRGGFVDRKGTDCTKAGGTEILGSHDAIWAPGGQGVMSDEEAGGPIIYYHYLPYNTTTNQPEIGYKFGWNKLDFDTDGWPTVVT